MSFRISSQKSILTEISNLEFNKNLIKKYLIDNLNILMEDKDLRRKLGVLGHKKTF